MPKYEELAEELLHGDRVVSVTDTNYSYCLCPKCANGQVMQLVDYSVIEDRPRNAYESRQGCPRRIITIELVARCLECGHERTIKNSNGGFQTGKIQHSAAFRMAGERETL